MTRTWIRSGALVGLAGALAYPAFLLIPMPTPLLMLVLTLFGLGISISAYGSYKMLTIQEESMAAQIGCAACAVAGVAVTAMLFVQVAIRAEVAEVVADPQGVLSPDAIAVVYRLLESVHLGLDLWWDVYLCLGAIMIAWAMRHHPRFGWGFSITGLIVAVPLAVLNLATAPTPPGSAGLVDLGPVIGLWFLATAIQTIRSFRWVDEQLAGPGSNQGEIGERRAQSA
jgi:hypothetical protein